MADAGRHFGYDARRQHRNAIDAAAAALARLYGPVRGLLSVPGGGALVRRPGLFLWRLYLRLCRPADLGMALRADGGIPEFSACLGPDHAAGDTVLAFRREAGAGAQGQAARAPGTVDAGTGTRLKSARPA